ncbi:hypothetical protein [Tenacibaculum sp. M341]|uniref:hypothetical protein n=1 Tax=Tenacibaculum sp. M341 TaxID=2530339 RepID=UPI00104D2E0C|nr:hypothetical protein [Tenacibaculum sp. M341]TCI92541.1 hypothetical protein EYW44_06480 [Tenacibaculum sp. M341]
MKKILKKSIYIICLSLIMVVNNSCTDESKFKNPVTFHLENGAFVTFEEVPPTSFKPEEAQSVSINANLIDPAGNVSQYDLSVTATITSLGETFTVENFRTVTSFPSQLSFTSQDLADAFGVDISTFGAGDFFQFTAVTTRNDGTKFYSIQPSFDEDNGTIGLGNTEGNLLNEPSYKDAMTFDYIIACPMPNSYFTGTYEVELISAAGSFGPIFGAAPVEVEIEAKNVYQRTMDLVYLLDLGIGQSAMPFEITFLCGEAFPTNGQNTFLGCGGTIFLSSGGTTPYADGTFDDDDEITITVLEDFSASGCSGTTANVTLRLTKK